MQDSTTYSTPMALGNRLNKIDSVSFSDVSLYRSTFGVFQNVTPTRPKIAFSINKLSQFLSAPIDVHWKVNSLASPQKGTEISQRHH